MQKPSEPIKNEHLVKISLKTNIKSIINYSNYLLKKKDLKYITLSGLNNAIKRVIIVAEIMKVKVQNLHQMTKIDSVVFVNKDNQTIMPRMEITLSKFEPIKKEYGYQGPYSIEQISLIKSFKVGNKENNNLNKSFQIKRYSFYKKNNKNLKQIKKNKKKLINHSSNSIDLKNSTPNTSFGTPISNKDSGKKVFYFKI